MDIHLTKCVHGVDLTDRPCALCRPKPEAPARTPRYDIFSKYPDPGWQSECSDRGDWCKAEDVTKLEERIQELENLTK